MADKKEEEATRCTCGWVMPMKISVGVDTKPESLGTAAEALKLCKYVFYVTCPKCETEWESDGGDVQLKAKGQA